MIMEGTIIRKNEYKTWRSQTEGKWLIWRLETKCSILQQLATT